MHWTQTPEGRERMRQIAISSRSGLKKARKVKKFKQLAKIALKSKPNTRTSSTKHSTKPKHSTKHSTGQTSLVVNGWRITLSNDEIRIDYE